MQQTACGIQEINTTDNKTEMNKTKRACYPAGDKTPDDIRWYGKWKPVKVVLFEFNGILSVAAFAPVKSYSLNTAHCCHVNELSRVK